MQERIGLCELCCGNIEILTVTGRFENIVGHERICTLCTIEGKYRDEFHYLRVHAFTNRGGATGCRVGICPL